ncbi:MAG: cysteine desulfurase [Methyloprofundus sp.]|nr:cysteine desulfurase [Methyloprofundus sp.]
MSEKPIYFDYQATTPIDPRVFEAMKPYYLEHFANPHSTEHAMGQTAAAAVKVARQQVAKLINALPEEVIFTSGATESNNHVIASTLIANKTAKKTILISEIEHKSVSEPAYFYADLLGYQVKIIPVDPTGRIELEAYKELLDDSVLLVSIMTVNNEIGTLQDIKLLSKLAHESGALFHTDAAQATTNQFIDVEDWDVDFMSLSAHKMYGPKGIGALFIHTALISDFPPFLHGGGQQDGLRSGTLPVPLCVGFGKAAEIMKNELRESIKKTLKLRKKLIGLLQSKSKIIINGSLQNNNPGCLNISIEAKGAVEGIEKIKYELAISSSSACSSNRSNKNSKNHTTKKQKEMATLRIGLGKDSRVNELELFAEKLNY